MPKTNRRCIYFSAGAVFLLVLVGVRQQVSLAEYRIRLAYAHEQIEIFHAMVRESREADGLGSKHNAKYVLHYYPSGTKQVTGSQIDALVESCRRFAVEEIEWISVTASRRSVE